MSVELAEHQLLAIDRLKNGSILYADVGLGKSRTALAYYYMKECGGKLKVNGEGEFSELETPKDLYIITTARKRDTQEWELECAPFLISSDRNLSISNVKLTVDSWNNIHKYCNVCNAFFIFDEQRLVGNGPWVKAFYQIAKKNRWILLSATPGDQWTDYIPVFIANGFYKNRTEFMHRHAVFARYSRYPKIERWLEQGRLLKLKSLILVDMYAIKPAIRNDIEVPVSYDRALMRTIMRERWNPFDKCMIDNMSQLVYLMRKAVNSDISRVEAVENLIKENPKSIIFYNFDYELEILRNIAKDLGIDKAEWNGHLHQPIPKSSNWIYLVQYTAGAEGWNCTDTNVMIFYSYNYSYKTTVQAAGRIDRLNTPFQQIYYYHLTSKAGIDLAIKRALDNKKQFNEASYIKKLH